MEITMTGYFTEMLRTNKPLIQKKFIHKTHFLSPIDIFLLTI